MLRSVDPASSATPESSADTPVLVREFREILLWPLRLMHVHSATGKNQRPWELLDAMGDDSPWREEVDEYTGESARFHERHYNEFVSFLPYVQRFLYGEGRKHRGHRRHQNAAFAIGKLQAGAKLCG